MPPPDRRTEGSTCGQEDTPAHRSDGEVKGRRSLLSLSCSSSQAHGESHEKSQSCRGMICDPTVPLQTQCPQLLGQEALLCDPLPPGTTYFHVSPLSFPLIPLGNARVKAGTCWLSSPRLSPGLAILGTLLRPVDEQGNGSAGSESSGKHRHPPPTAPAHRGEGLRGELKMDQIKPVLLPTPAHLYPRAGSCCHGGLFPCLCSSHSREKERGPWLGASRGAT